MRNAIRLATAAALAATFTLFMGGAAQAYPDPTITISIPGNEIIGGDTFDFTASSGDVDCDWTVTYGGAQQTGSGTSISGTYDTPAVSKRTATTITAVCEYQTATSSASAAATAEVSAADTASASATVYLLPRGGDTDGGSDDNGALPDTGGSNLWIVIVGAALLVVGAAALALSRRRSH